MCDSSEINVILLIIMCDSIMLFNLLIIMCDSSEINVIQAY